MGDQSTSKSDRWEAATFGLGCFWCAEAIFQRVRGVCTAAAGYMGGTLGSPTGDQLSAGVSGFAEVVQVTFDRQIVSYPELLEVFWRTHDPTTPNRQGADVGPKYRSVLFYHTSEQKELAEAYKKELDAAGAFNEPIVTEIAPAQHFYPAGEEDQNFYNLNPEQPYCQRVITPKLLKLKRVFREKFKAVA
jgi:peptide-methionine (S)-S-oxide reductase